MGQRELVALLSLSSWCLVIVVWLPHGAMGLSAVCDCGTNFPDHTHSLLFSVLTTMESRSKIRNIFKPHGSLGC